MANLVSLIRVLLCFVSIALLFLPGYWAYLSSFFLSILVIWMDGLDGYLARKLKESSKMGAVVDILSDRIVEQVYWITFLALGWVPLWIPLVVIVRGILVDALRSIALEQGLTAFGESTMMQSKLGVLLVSSRFSRWTYAVTKAAAFCFTILAYTPSLEESVARPFAHVAQGCIYGAVVFCVIRGLPVLWEGRRFFREQKSC